VVCCGREYTSFAAGEVRIVENFSVPLSFLAEELVAVVIMACWVNVCTQCPVGLCAFFLVDLLSGVGGVVQQFDHDAAFVHHGVAIAVKCPLDMR